MSSIVFQARQNVEASPIRVSSWIWTFCTTDEPSDSRLLGDPESDTTSFRSVQVVSVLLQSEQPVAFSRPVPDLLGRRRDDHRKVRHTSRRRDGDTLRWNRIYVILLAHYIGVPKQDTTFDPKHMRCDTSKVWVNQLSRIQAALAQSNPVAENCC